MHKTFNIPFMGYKTHCDVFGDIKKNTPLIILHGGPGGCSQRYEPLIELSNRGIPVILYDQLGSGYSKVQGEHYELWTTDTFMDELENLINYFNLRKYYLLGHSWGGMLALSFVINRKHKGLKKLILYSTLPSTKIWNEEHLKMIANYEQSIKNELTKDLTGEKHDEKIYKKGLKMFYRDHVKATKKKYVFKRKRFPKLFNQVYKYMWGPSELFGTGTLKTYNVENELININIETLILSGELDESTPTMNKLMNDNIRNSKWICYKNCHHSSYVEEPELVLNDISNFLND